MFGKALTKKDIGKIIGITLLVAVIGILVWSMREKQKTEPQEQGPAKPLLEYTEEEKQDVLERLQQEGEGFNYTPQEMLEYLERLQNNE
ncbi:MAG: hypothetical protein Q8P39_02835 [Candidatus Yanofskybacteria bacterium]|nr:hypothetical protein [Candidatus Yanofskybacteria bacterium]